MERSCSQEVPFLAALVLRRVDVRHHVDDRVDEKLWQEAEQEEHGLVADMRRAEIYALLESLSWGTRRHITSSVIKSLPPRSHRMKARGADTATQMMTSQDVSSSCPVSLEVPYLTTYICSL